MLLGSRRGRFELREIPRCSQPVTIQVANGELASTYCGSESLDTEQARTLLQDLLCQTKGEFEFTDDTAEYLTEHQRILRLPFEQVLLMVAELKGEELASQRSFADPRTKFEVTSVEAQLDDALCDFWRKTKVLFQGCGATAEEISATLKCR